MVGCKKHWSLEELNDLWSRCNDMKLGRDGGLGSRWTVRDDLSQQPRFSQTVMNSHKWQRQRQRQWQTQRQSPDSAGWFVSPNSRHLVSFQTVIDSKKTTHKDKDSLGRKIQKISFNNGDGDDTMMMMAILPQDRVVWGGCSINHRWTLDVPAWNTSKKPLPCPQSFFLASFML